MAQDVSINNRILKSVGYDTTKLDPTTLLDMRKLARSDFLEFIPLFYPRLKLNWFHREVADLLMQLESGITNHEEPRLMLAAPPRHSKSLMTTRCFPAWFLGRHPERDVIVISATQTMAEYFGLAIRDTLTSPHFTNIFPACVIRDDASSKSLIATTKGGILKGAGVGAQIVGAGAALLLLDDPIASEEQAKSTNEMAKMKTWFETSAMSRLAEDAAVVIMHQRWDVNNLIGQLIKENDANWKYHAYPRLATKDEPHRKKGEALQPERYSTAATEKLRDRLVKNGQERVWLSLYQQEPRNEEGNFFKRDSLEKCFTDAEPPSTLIDWYLGTDFATSAKKTANHTCFVPVGVDPDNLWWIGRDMFYGRVDSLEAMDELCKICSKSTRQFGFFATEKGVITNLLAPLVKELRKKNRLQVPSKLVTRVSSKHIHASVLQAKIDAGLFRFPNTPFFRTVVLTQFLNFDPKIDDQEDDIIDALVNLTLVPEGIHPPSVPAAEKETTDEEYEKQRWTEIESQNRKKIISGRENLYGNPYPSDKKAPPVRSRN